MRSFFPPKRPETEVKEPIHLSKKNFAEADAMTQGQIIRQGDEILGGCNGGAAKEEVLQPHIQKGSMLPFVNRAFGFKVLAHVSTLVGDVTLGG